MVTARFPLERAAEALDADRIPGSIKAVVTRVMTAQQRDTEQFDDRQAELRSSEITVGIVHFGVGGFHRAHQAMYVDRLLERGMAERVGHLRRRGPGRPIARWPT